ncbi:MAG: hypothetical protein ACFFC7_33015 [Candidatus Hermodarchaeota archaeon]
MLTTSAPSLLWKYRTEGSLTPSPALVDLNADEELEVIFASGDGNIYVENGNNGSLVWMF